MFAVFINVKRLQFQKREYAGDISTALGVRSHHHREYAGGLDATSCNPHFCIKVCWEEITKKIQSPFVAVALQSHRLTYSTRHL